MDYYFDKYIKYKTKYLKYKIKKLDENIYFKNLAKELDVELEKYTVKDFFKLNDIAKLNINTKKITKLAKALLIINFLNNEINFKFNQNIKIDSRIFKYINFFKNWMKWCKKHSINVPNSKLYLYVSDTYYYEDQNLPFCIISKPMNKKGIFFPEDTINCTKKKNLKDGKCYNHDEYKQLFEKQCKISFESKIDKIFFSGASTGSDKWDLRTLLKNKFINNENINIIINEIYIDQTEFCKFKILLDLPGNQPWSYRFRELFLTGSLVVHISVSISYDNGLSWNYGQKLLWNSCFIKDRDYIEIEYKWIYNNEDFNNNQLEILVNELEILFKDIKKNKDKYKKIANNGYTIMNNINMNIFYNYILYLTKKISEIQKN